MGHKVHPIGFRLGIIKDWQSKWYSDTHYPEFVLEDNRLREYIKNEYREAGISLIEIERQAKDVNITLHTARPGIVIGRGGQRVEEMRQNLEKLIGKKVHLNILEVRQPELDAYLVARSVAEQIERRVAYRRAMKQAIFRTIQAGARGIKISCAGRLANAEIARRQTSHQGQVPLHTLRADIDYGFTEAHTTLGRIGIKVWIYKGQVIPEAKAAASAKPEAVARPAAEPVAEAAPPAPTTAEKPAVEKPAEAPSPVVVEAAPEPAPAEKKPRPKAKKPAAEPVKEEKAEKPALKPEPAPEATKEESVPAPKRRRKAPAKEARKTEGAEETGTKEG